MQIRFLDFEIELFWLYFICQPWMVAINWFHSLSVNANDGEQADNVGKALDGENFETCVAFKQIALSLSKLCGYRH